MLELIKYNELINNDDLGNEYNILKEFKINIIADFTIDALNRFSSKSKLKKANEVADIVLFLLQEKGLRVAWANQGFVDIAISASLLHNIEKVDIDKWDNVFKIRKKLTEVAKDHPSISREILDSICSTIESQLGHRMPIAGCRPNPSTANEHLSLAIAFANRK